MELTPEQLVTIILGGVGVFLQIAFMYFGKFSQWYQNHPNKGLVALGFAFLFGIAYFGLSCTPYAGPLKIALSCTQDGLFVLGRAIFIIAVAQQTAYGYSKKIIQTKFAYLR